MCTVFNPLFSLSLPLNSTMHTHTRLSLCLLVCVCLCVPILYVQLWDVSSELPRVVHSLGPCCVLAWQPQAGNTGTMLLAGYENSA